MKLPSPVTRIDLDVGPHIHWSMKSDYLRTLKKIAFFVFFSPSFLDSYFLQKTYQNSEALDY